MFHPRSNCLISICTIAVLIAPLVLSQAAPQQIAQPGRVEWIDTHIHLVGGLMLRGYKEALWVAMKAMDEAGIKKSVIMPPPQISGARGIHDFESFVRGIKQYPGRFGFLGGGGTLNPMIQATAQGDVSESLKREFKAKAEEIAAQGALGFGEITAHHLSLTHDHPYESVPADHPLLLLLAEIAAQHDLLFDFHFDVVAEEMNLPQRFSSPPNPPVLRANLAAFKRLLSHNRKAKIVWAHAGSDFIGHWTVSLSRRMLEKHPNLHMSLRLGGGIPGNQVLDSREEVKPEWLELLRDFSDRFVIGGDQFFVSPGLAGSGPGLRFAQVASINRNRSIKFLASIPADLARKVGYENAIRLYKFKE